MSNDSWLSQLKQMLTALRTKNDIPRIAIVGIGHDLCGDDVAGVVIARVLKYLTRDLTHVLTIEGGSAPENQLGSLRRFCPALVLLVDAAEMNKPPGSIGCLAWETTTGLSATTHTLPPALFAQYLYGEIGCQIILIGIQPACLDFDMPLSPAVKKAVKQVTQQLSVVLGAE